MIDKELITQMLNRMDKITDAQTFDIKAHVFNSSNSFVSLVSLEAYYI